MFVPFFQEAQLSLAQPSSRAHSLGDMTRHLTSLNLRIYPSELNIHFPGLEGLDRPMVWAFPKLVVCVDRGYPLFTLSDDQVAS